MIPAFINDSVISRINSRLSRTDKQSMTIFFFIFALGTVLSWLWTATPVADLSNGSNLSESNLYMDWARGNVVVMVRHAERCDRSTNPCLGSADGITVSGSRSASAVGNGLRRLGLDKAQMIASPLTRTRQTADFILGRSVQTQSWVGDCASSFNDAVSEHKQPAENLVLITHSGCIDQFERKMGVRAGERSADYTQALFVKMDGQKAPSIIGSLSAAQWKNIIPGQVNL
ncbi:histidine phosphatase family protein [Pseudomonas prosekii]|nr:histidine phosphatase family protein [Pseudomonas prosekii]